MDMAGDEAGATNPYVVPVTITLDGPGVDLLVRLELDTGGYVELTPTQARAIAADLDAMADEAEA